MNVYNVSDAVAHAGAGAHARMNAACSNNETIILSSNATPLQKNQARAQNFATVNCK